MKKMRVELYIMALFLVLALSSFVKPASAATPIIQGSGFNLIFNTGESLIFQHLNPSFNVNLTVLSGTLNGTSGSLLMYAGSGQISFRSLSTATLNMTCSNPNVKISYSNVQANRNYEFSWALQTVYEFWGWTTILATFGFIGMFVSIGLMIHNFKEGEYQAALMMLVAFIACFALFYGWVVRA